MSRVNRWTTRAALLVPPILAFASCSGPDPKPGAPAEGEGRERPASIEEARAAALPTWQAARRADGSAATFDPGSARLFFAIDRFYYLHTRDGLYESTDGVVWTRLLTVPDAPNGNLTDVDVIARRGAWPNDRVIVTAGTDGVRRWRGDGKTTERLRTVLTNALVGYCAFARPTDPEPPLEVVAADAGGGALTRWIEKGPWTPLVPDPGKQPFVGFWKVRAARDAWTDARSVFVASASPRTLYREMIGLWSLDAANRATPSSVPFPARVLTSPGSANGTNLFLAAGDAIYRCDWTQATPAWVALSKPTPPMGSDGPATRVPTCLAWDAERLIVGFDAEGVCTAAPGWAAGFDWFRVGDGFPRQPGHGGLPANDPCHFLTARRLACGPAGIVAVVDDGKSHALWFVPAPPP